jgi:uncharacterized membrane protein
MGAAFIISSFNGGWQTMFEGGCAAIAGVAPADTPRPSFPPYIGACTQSLPKREDCCVAATYGIMIAASMATRDVKESVIMPLSQSKVFIAAPPEEVWALISDLERGPEWSLVTLQCEITSDGPLGVGCTYRAVSRFVASKITTEHEVLEWIPPYKIVTKVIEGAESTFTQICEPQGEGTVLTMRNEFAVPAGVPGFLANKLEQQVTDTLGQELARIKEVVEGSHEGNEMSFPGAAEEVSSPGGNK